MHTKPDSQPSRRRFLGGLTALGASVCAYPALGRTAWFTPMLGESAWTVPGAFADELEKTPRMTEGPFYPNKLPLDTDNDLIILNDNLTPAVGEITHLSGRILNVKGDPIKNAVIEIWQVDNNGAYLHSGSANSAKRDSHFQGFGRFLTDSTGAYYFRTIKPVTYPGRTPHIHFLVRQNDKRLLTSQFFIKDHPQNQRDGIYQSLDPAARKLVTIEFSPLNGSTVGELFAKKDIVVGVTPPEPGKES